MTQIATEPTTPSTIVASTEQAPWRDPSKWVCVERNLGDEAHPNRKKFLVSPPFLANGDSLKDAYSVVRVINRQSKLLAVGERSKGRLEAHDIDTDEIIARCAYVAPSRREAGCYVILIDCDSATNLSRLLDLPPDFNPSPVNDPVALSEVQNRRIQGFRSFQEIQESCPPRPFRPLAEIQASSPAHMSR